MHRYVNTAGMATGQKRYALERLNIELDYALKPLREQILKVQEPLLLAREKKATELTEKYSKDIKALGLVRVGTGWQHQGYHGDDRQSPKEYLPKALRLKILAIEQKQDILINLAKNTEEKIMLGDNAAILAALEAFRKEAAKLK